jgi:hypothetical protein
MNRLRMPLPEADGETTESPHEAHDRAVATARAAMTRMVQPPAADASKEQTMTLCPQ